MMILLTAGTPLRGATQRGDPPPSSSKKKTPRPGKLGERLIRKVTGDGDEDVMDEIIRLMAASARRLTIEFDVGDDTQLVQSRIVDRLDAAIQQAAARRRPLRRRQPSRSSDKRRMARRDQASRKKTSSANARDAKGTSSSSADGTAKPVVDRLEGGDLRETRRTWGHLPLREREEIIQGVGERFLERYRQWIERYYRALQESEE